MIAATYIIITLICAACAVLLLRAYQHERIRLLLWSGLCFAGLALSNLLVFLDNIIFLQYSLYTFRLATAAIAMTLLVIGLIWESD